MPAGVRFLPDPGNASEPNYDVNAHVDFWLAGVPDETRPRARGWNIVTRLRRGITRDRAQAEVAEIAARQARSDANLEGLTASVRPLLDELNQQGSGSRTKEMAVRKAIGAQQHTIVRLVLGEGIRLIALGGVLGVVLAVLVGRVLSTLLFEVRAADPMTLAGSAVVFAAVALIACTLPAWRAARTDLMEALRHE